MVATKCVNMDNLNPCIKVMEYAVRGPLVIRATEIEKELEQVSAQSDRESAQRISRLRSVAYTSFEWEMSATTSVTNNNNK